MASRSETGAKEAAASPGRSRSSARRGGRPRRAGPCSGHRRGVRRRRAAARLAGRAGQQRRHRHRRAAAPAQRPGLRSGPGQPWPPTSTAPGAAARRRSRTCADSGYGRIVNLSTTMASLERTRHPGVSRLPDLEGLPQHAHAHAGRRGEGRRHTRQRRIAGLHQDGHEPEGDRGRSSRARTRPRGWPPCPTTARPEASSTRGSHSSGEDAHRTGSAGRPGDGAPCAAGPRGPGRRAALPAGRQRHHRPPGHGPARRAGCGVGRAAQRRAAVHLPHLRHHGRGRAPGRLRGPASGAGPRHRRDLAGARHRERPCSGRPAADARAGRPLRHLRQRHPVRRDLSAHQPVRTPVDAGGAGRHRGGARSQGHPHPAGDHGVGGARQHRAQPAPASTLPASG